jgi:hypothetical protein
VRGLDREKLYPLGARTDYHSAGRVLPNPVASARSDHFYTVLRHFFGSGLTLLA